MTNEVGIYRGSFDPPHNGHLEVVTHALKSGMSSVSIIYQDTNRFKPLRTNDSIRYELLKTMFAGMQNVILSQKSFESTLIELQSDTTIRKIHQIVGSDIIDQPIRPIKSPSKLSYFIIPREEFPIKTSLIEWNSLPAIAGKKDQFKEQYHSSTQVRSWLLERNYTKAKLALPSEVFDQIIKQKFYTQTDTEFKHQEIVQEIKKITQEAIVTKKIVPKEQYPLTFHLGNDIGISGLSGDIVCFVKDKDGLICLVVKIFLGSHLKEHYESELLGNKTISELNLKLIKVPKIYFANQLKNFAYIGMSFAEGKPLADIMRDNSEAIELCARANLELHTAQRMTPSKISHEQIALFESAIDIVTTRLPNFEIASKMKKKWEEIHKSFLSNPGKLSFTHGDPNHSNWIVDLNNKCVTYIDLSLFHRSISPDGKPNGFAINELEESLTACRIVAKRIGGFSKEKILEVKNAYKTAYMQYAPDDITTKEARAYFYSYWSLRIMKSLLGQIAQSSSSDLTQKYQTQLQDKINEFLGEKYEF